MAAITAADFLRAIVSSPALVTLCIFPFASLLAFAIYQLYFHPLAQYPGPLLGRITRLYDLYHAYKGDKHIVLYHLHQRYGTVVRYCPNTVSINDPAALKAIYSHGANVTKNEFYKVSFCNIPAGVAAAKTAISASARHRTPSARFWPLKRRITRRSDVSLARHSPTRPCEGWRSTSWSTLRR